MMSGARGVLPGWPGRGHCCHADQSRDANGDCPDDGEDDLPGVGGHGVFHDAMCRVVAGESRRRDEGECDHEAYPKRTDEGEQELPEAERQCSGDEADDDRAEPACTGLRSEEHTSELQSLMRT